MNVLLLKESEENDKYHKCFHENGFPNVQSIPVLEFEYCNLEGLKLFSENFEQYSGLIFTSRRAIQAFALAVDKTQIEVISRSPDLNIYVVGRTSETCLDKLGLSSRGSDTGNAKELSEYIINENKNVVKPLMFACGNLARETVPTRLADAGIKCETISCYKTVPNKTFVEKLEEYYSKTKPDVIGFFSPSGAEFYLSQIRQVIQNFSNTKLVAIGQYTGETLVKLNGHVDGIAMKPTPESLLEVVKKFLKPL